MLDIIIALGIFIAFLAFMAHMLDRWRRYIGE